jgi:hypothetical protein
LAAFAGLPFGELGQQDHGQSGNRGPFGPASRRGSQGDDQQVEGKRLWRKKLLGLLNPSADPERLQG